MINFRLDMKRWIVLGAFLLIIWFSLLAFWWMKADEISRDPCSICAERMGEEVTCSTGYVYVSTKTYYPNGSSKIETPNINPNEIRTHDLEGG